MIRKDAKKEGVSVLQTIGNPHSGSTIIAIILGSQKEIFNAGELKNICMMDFTKEYCSCGKLINNCSFWSKVFSTWQNKSQISWSEYKDLYLRYEKVLSIPRLILAVIKPSARFKKYVLSTRILYESILDLSGKQIILDSSKMPQRSFMLSKFSNLELVHLVRPFSQVLNSAQRPLKMDPKRGIEKDKEGKSTFNIFIRWLFVNVLCETIGLLFKSKKVFFNEFRNDPNVLNAVRPNSSAIDYSVMFHADHMVAGNRLRMKRNIFFKKKENSELEYLNRWQYNFSTLIDFIFFFWSKRGLSKTVLK